MTRYDEIFDAWIAKDRINMKFLVEWNDGREIVNRWEDVQLHPKWFIASVSEWVSGLGWVVIR
jgi:hypothetical protein